jgi:hypothetical protein
LPLATGFVVSGCFSLKKAMQPRRG